MTDKQIIIEDYFNIMRDDYGRIYGIQDIGDTKELIKAIREQNEYIKAKEKECKELEKNYFTVIQQRNVAEQQLDQLKAENEQLKNNDVFSIRYFKDKNEKLKQALSEIKEVAKELLQTKIPFCTIHEKIMKIISEVDSE